MSTETRWHCFVPHHFASSLPSSAGHVQAVLVSAGPSARVTVVGRVPHDVKFTVYLSIAGWYSLTFVDLGQHPHERTVDRNRTLTHDDVDY